MALSEKGPGVLNSTSPPNLSNNLEDSEPRSIAKQEFFDLEISMEIALYKYISLNGLNF